jgi:hypothetical protein
MNAGSSSHFVDDGTPFVDYLRRYTVVCPVCGSAAHVAISDEEAPVLFAPRRLACVSCGHTREWRKARLQYPSPEEAIDWYFGLPYFFQRPCAGHVLWVANREHLEFVRAYVGAKHRTRKRDVHGWKNRSAASRMPKWISDAKNRSPVLKALDDLEAKMKKRPNKAPEPTTGLVPTLAVARGAPASSVAHL